MLYKELLQIGRDKLINSGIDVKIAKQNCEDILMHITHFSNADLITKINQENQEAKQTEEIVFNKAISDRCKKKPIQYITNNAVFFGYNFFVNESCLIPRVDSEVLVERAVEFVENNRDKFYSLNILDACCGSGCLGLSFVKTIKAKYNDKIKTDLTLLDKSQQAIQIAKINSQKLDVKAKFIVSDVLTNGFGFEKYDIIFCNPPYIETKTIEKLDDEVKKYEPKMALDGGEDGLFFYKTISKKLKNNLTKNGSAFFEIGYNQGNITQEIFKNNGFNVEIVKDYGKQDRCLIVC